MPVYAVPFQKPLSSIRLASRDEVDARFADGSADQELELQAMQDAMRAEWQRVIASVQEVNRQMAQQNQSHQQLLGGLQRDIVDLATAIAVQVVGESEVKTERVQELVREMLAQFEGADGPMHVFLHPDDCAALRDGDDMMSDSSLDFETHPDPNLERGSCRVEGPQFGYVRHWKLHVAAIRQSLMEQLHD